MSFYVNLHMVRVNLRKVYAIYVCCTYVLRMFYACFKGGLGGRSRIVEDRRPLGDAPSETPKVKGYSQTGLSHFLMQVI